MAQQINSIPSPLEPKPEFRNRVHVVTEKRAEALIAGLDLLEVARSGEAIDLLQGLIGAKATIMDQVADYASKPATITALRNLVALVKILGDLNIEGISKFVDELKPIATESVSQDATPSTWQLIKYMDQPDVRRGLYFLLRLTEALGRAVKPLPTD